MYLYLNLYIYICALSDWPGRQIKPLTEILEDRKLKLLGHVLRRDRQHGLHQAAFSTRSALPRETEHRRRGRPRQFWTTNNMSKVKHGKWLRRMMLHNRKYHSTRTTDRCVRGLLNKRSDTNPHSTKETQYETCNVKVLLGVTPLLSVKLSSVWHLYSVWNFCSVWHLHSVWNFCSVWSFYYTGRFRFNTPPSSERGPRFLIVGRKQVSAYALWQCPCYRLWQGKKYVCILSICICIYAYITRLSLGIDAI